MSLYVGDRQVCRLG